MTSFKPLDNESALLGKTADGDQLAFKVLYDCYYNRIFGFAFQMLQSDILAEEVVQESMLKIWQLGDELRNINSFEGYLKTIAKRITLNMLKRKELERKAARSMGLNWKELHNETEEKILLNESRKILEAGIALLPQQQRLVYQLCQKQGLKYEEAAEQLNISHGSVQTHMKLALKFLRIYVHKNTDLTALLVIFKLL